MAAYQYQRRKAWKNADLGGAEAKWNQADLKPEKQRCLHALRRWCVVRQK